METKEVYEDIGQSQNIDYTAKPFLGFSHKINTLFSIKINGFEKNHAMLLLEIKLRAQGKEHFINTIQSAIGTMSHNKTPAAEIETEIKKLVEKLKHHIISTLTSMNADSKIIESVKQWTYDYKKLNDRKNSV